MLIVTDLRKPERRNILVNVSWVINFEKINGKLSVINERKKNIFHILFNNIFGWCISSQLTLIYLIYLHIYISFIICLLSIYPYTSCIMCKWLADAKVRSFFNNFKIYSFLTNKIHQHWFPTIWQFFIPYLKKVSDLEVIPRILFNIEGER